MVDALVTALLRNYEAISRKEEISFTTDKAKLIIVNEFRVRLIKLGMSLLNQLAQLIQRLPGS